MLTACREGESVNVPTHQAVKLRKSHELRTNRFSAAPGRRGLAACPTRRSRRMPVHRGPPWPIGGASPRTGALQHD